MVLVTKSCEAPWMCVAFTNINDACPKDFYPLSSINQLVDIIVVYDIMSFLDTYSSYHQIRMSLEGEEKIAFITEDMTLCYRRMPFSLKNTGMAYQKLVNKMFEGHLGRNMRMT